MSDEELLARMRAGDPRAWRELVSRYQRLVYAVPRRYGLCKEAASDVFQDVWLALLRGLPRLRDAKALPRWLMQTAYRLSRDRRRRERRESTDSSEEFWAGLADPRPGVEEEMMRLEAAAGVRGALSTLAPRCRELIEALFLEDPPAAYAEAARRLGIPLGSLGPTRQRCLDRLLQALADGGIKSRSGITSGTRAGKRQPPARGRT